MAFDARALAMPQKPALITGMSMAYWQLTFYCKMLAAKSSTAKSNRLANFKLVNFAT